jgi:hypothetical protein
MCILLLIGGYSFNITKCREWDVAYTPGRLHELRRDVRHRRICGRYLHGCQTGRTERLPLLLYPTDGRLQGLADTTSKDGYTNAALRGLRAVVAQVSPTGEVSNVSFGTPMGHTLQFYKDIPLTAMPYGQALAMLALVEWQRWKVLA